MNKESKFISVGNGLELHAQIKEVGSKVWLVATHGIGEHLGRHNYLHDIFGHDLNIFQYDLRGHGKSIGRRAYIDDFSDYMNDLKLMIQFLRKRYKMERFVLFGHSMGALITSGFLKNYVTEDIYPEAVFINAPPVGLPGKLGQVFSEYIPLEGIEKLKSLPFSLRLGGLVDLNKLSHASKVAINYKKDPLNSLKLHTKLLMELAYSSKDVFSSPLSPKCPAFCSYGSEDVVVDIAMLEDYFKNIETSFELKKFNGAYHEIHNEIKKYRDPYLSYLEKSIKEVIFD